MINNNKSNNKMVKSVIMMFLIFIRTWFGSWVKYHFAVSHILFKNICKGYGIYKEKWWIIRQTTSADQVIPDWLEIPFETNLQSQL